MCVPVDKEEHFGQAFFGFLSTQNINKALKRYSFLARLPVVTSSIKELERTGTGCKVQLEFEGSFSRNITSVIVFVLVSEELRLIVVLYPELLHGVCHVAPPYFYSGLQGTNPSLV